MALYTVAEQGGEMGGMKTFAQATRLAVDMAEKALNSGGHVSGITTGLDGLNTKTRRPAPVRSRHRRRAPGHGQELARHQHRFQCPRGAGCATWRTALPRRSRSARRSPSSISKCRPISSRRVFLAEQFRYFQPVPAHGPHQSWRLPESRARFARSAGPAALYRRYRRPHHCRVAHARAPPQAPSQDRSHHRRLSSAASGFGQGERQSRQRDFGNQPRSQDARQGAQCPGRRALSAQPCGRKPGGQAPATFGLARIRLDRAGRGHGLVPLTARTITR